MVIGYTPPIANENKVGVFKVDGDSLVIEKGKLKKYEVPIYSFSTGTDEQIAAMLDAYYSDKLAQEDMGQAIGDTRLIHLNEMQAPNPNSSSIQEAQDITIVIVDHDHTDLATPINGHTKACITVQTREILSGTSMGTAGWFYVNGDSSYDTTFTKQSNLYMRTYLNNTILNNISSENFKSIIKQSKHYRHSYYNYSDSEQVTDTLFLPSYSEIFGTVSASYYEPTSPVEGTQFEYYQTSSNRRKYINNNGISGENQYWQNGSPGSYYSSSSTGYTQGYIKTDGTQGMQFGNVAYGLAPAQAM